MTRGASERGWRVSQHPLLGRGRAGKSTISSEGPPFTETLHAARRSKTKSNAMPSEDPPENDGGRRHPISPGLRRALVFVLLGPVFGVVAAYSVVAVMISGYRVDTYGIPIAFFFSLIICAITGPVDGVLAYIAPISLRAPLTTIVGAAVAVGLSLFLWAQLGNKTVAPSLYSQIPIAVIGALCTGVCSLLSHNRRNQKI